MQPMEMRPPCIVECEHFTQTDDRRSTHNSVVLATDSVGAALAATNTDNADGGAVEAEYDVQALNDDAKQAEQEASSRRIGLTMHS